MKNFLLSLLDWIYKKKCYFCGSSKESSRMCSKCYDTLEFTPFETDRTILNSKVYACSYYQGNMQKLIRGLKYHRQRELAFFQAKFMWEYLQNITEERNFIVIPVPLAKERQKQRHYNHMELVAEDFCKLSGMKYNFDLIKRIKNTKPQYRLKRKERIENLKNAFIVNPSELPKSPILLIDDICTTGSTFESIILELNKNNIYNITCLATATVDF